MNCFICNDISHFTSFTSKPLRVKQLNGSTVPALGYGLKLIQCPSSLHIIPLWPTYYMPSNPQCTFSPTALKHYLPFQSVCTTHLHSLSLVTSDGVKLSFPSLPDHARHQLLDYHRFIVVHPTQPLPSSPTNPSKPIAASATSEAPLTRDILHQRFGHGCDEVLDLMCHHQSLIGLPKRLFPPR